jgi:hypothetical protein
MNEVLQAKPDSLWRGEGPHNSKGILPLAKSSFEQWSFSDVSGNKKFSGWSLPGHGGSYYDCGKWIMRGCLNVEAHRQQILDGDAVDKAYVKLTKRSCGRFECPVCHEKAFAKAAHRIEHRLSAFKVKGRELKVIHVIVSPSSLDLYKLRFVDLRRKCLKVLKDAGVFGGSIIFHPWRRLGEDDDFEKTAGAWYLSPHFHVLGYGWVQRVKEVYDRDGWVVKNLGVRKSVNATAMYQLSHCGIHERRHSITWFGALSYNKLRVPRLEVEKELCPLCGQKLRLLMQIKRCAGLGDEEGEYYVDSDCFIPYPKSYG